MSFKTLEARLRYAGGDSLGRIQKQKFNSLISALANDYNSRTIMTEQGKIHQALINLNNLKKDYDKETISIPYDAHLHEGDVFEILDNHTHYMVYLPDLVETAYLKAEIIRCRYTITIEDKEYWVYFKGPVETDIPWEQKKGVNFSNMNLSGTIYIKNTPQTKAYFARFKKFKIAGHTWETQVVDYISVPGIIELEIKEYFENFAEELPEILEEPKHRICGEEMPQPIIGKTHMTSGSTIGFTALDAVYNENIKWEIKHNKHAKIDAVLENGKICKVYVPSWCDEDFTICYGKHELDIEVVKPPVIIEGPTEVYPYSMNEYCVHTISGYFKVDSDKAKIIKENGGTCTVEIITGKKGRFVLYYIEHGTGETFELPVEIKSL